MYCSKCGGLVTGEGDLCEFCEYNKKLAEAGIKQPKGSSFGGSFKTGYGGGAASFNKPTETYLIHNIIFLFLGGGILSIVGIASAISAKVSLKKRNFSAAESSATVAKICYKIPLYIIVVAVSLSAIGFAIGFFTAMVKSLMGAE
ncbi:MAG: hypothetical protein IJM30_11550 [Thermoguttaceae bacterium]|nr:hypothetical protein [Thermoguttaceae bacterium]